MIKQAPERYKKLRGIVFIRLLIEVRIRHSSLYRYPSGIRIYARI